MEDHELLSAIVGEYFPILEFVYDKRAPYFLVGDYSTAKFSALVEELDQVGYVPFINPDGLYYRIRLAHKPEEINSRIYINLILFLSHPGNHPGRGLHPGEQLAGGSRICNSITSHNWHTRICSLYLCP